MINCLVRAADEGEEEVNPITHKTGNRRELKISLERRCCRLEGLGGEKAVMNSTQCDSFQKVWVGGSKDCS